MDHPWDIVTAVCFCVLGIIVVVSVWFRAKLAAQCERLWQTGKRKNDPVVVSKSLQQAIARLAEVTENKGHRSEGRESRENLCPICLASLYGLPPDEAGGSESDTEEGKAAGEGVRGGDLEAGTLKKEPTVTTTPVAASADVAEMAEAAKKKMMNKLQKTKRTSWRPQPIDDEILKMRRCPHMFHARCLATWFLMKRYDCPVCRAAYYQTHVESDDELSGRESVVQPSTLGIPVLPFW
ncbi:hypothetical protein PG990_001791 [Apiospora arundinis]